MGPECLQRLGIVLIDLQARVHPGTRWRGDNEGLGDRSKPRLWHMRNVEDGCISGHLEYSSSVAVIGVMRIRRPMLTVRQVARDAVNAVTTS